MTNPFTECLIKRSRRSSHDRSPMPLELQRWEDDGGAVPQEASPRESDRHRRPLPQELAAAE